MNQACVPMWLLKVAICLTAASACVQSCLAAEPSLVGFTVTLHEGRYYSLYEFCQKANTELGCKYDLGELNKDARVELSAVDRAALLVAQEFGLVQVRIESDCLTILAADPENDEARRQTRARLERLLGIPVAEWPDGSGLKIPCNFDPRQRTLLLIHGLESGAEYFARFRSACEKAEIQTLTFEYPNDGPPAWAGKRLSAELKALATRHPELSLAVVGHSMGGLVARYAMETPGLDPECIGDLFLLGTPHQGPQWLASKTVSNCSVKLCPKGCGRRPHWRAA